MLLGTWVMASDSGSAGWNIFTWWISPTFEIIIWLKSTSQYLTGMQKPGGGHCQSASHFYLTLANCVMEYIFRIDMIDSDLVGDYC